MPITPDRPLHRRNESTWKACREAVSRRRTRPDTAAAHGHMADRYRVSGAAGGTLLAGEETANYGEDEPATSQPTALSISGSSARDRGADDVLATMTSSIDAALAIEHDELTDPELQAAITTVQRSYDQLAMLRASLVATLQARAAARAPKHRNDAGQREGTRFLRDELHMTPGEAKQTSEAGHELQSNDRTRRAWQAGDVGQGHAAVIGRALRQVDGRYRDDLEVELLEAATRMDPVALGRLARRRVGECAPSEAERSDRHRHLRRRASVRQDEHGDVIVSGSFSGTAGETIMASWRAFYDKPTGKDTRTHEQRGADAFEAMANAALRAGEAPTQHGERPHVLVVVRQEDLLRGSGMAQLGHTGPVPVASIGHLLRDSVMTHIGVDCEDAPIAVTSRVRSVPLGLWRALVVRDGGCTWAGCTAPVGWCDVAHGEEPYRRDGRLSPSNSALLCRTHHRRFDHGRWQIQVQGNEVTYRHPSDPPDPDDDTGPPDPDDPTGQDDPRGPHGSPDPGDLAEPPERGDAPDTDDDTGAPGHGHASDSGVDEPLDPDHGGPPASGGWADEHGHRAGDPPDQPTTRAPSQATERERLEPDTAPKLF